MARPVGGRLALGFRSRKGQTWGNEIHPGHINFLWGYVGMLDEMQSPAWVLYHWQYDYIIYAVASQSQC